MTTEPPEFQRPPVTEIVAAVQFLPVPRFGLREAVAVSREFEGWDVIDAAPALQPIVERPDGVLTPPSLRLSLGTPAVRVVLGSEEGRWLAQVQQDRVAAHERRTAERRPTFARVAERLREVAARASAGLGARLLGEPHRPEIVELIYDNTIRTGGGWADLGNLHEVLRIISPEAGEGRFARAGQTQVGFSYGEVSHEQLVRRVRVYAEPMVVPGEQPAIHLQLIARGIVGNRDVDDVLAESHTDIVEAFTAVTTEQMHERWGRTR